MSAALAAHPYEPEAPTDPDAVRSKPARLLSDLIDTLLGRAEEHRAKRDKHRWSGAPLSEHFAEGRRAGVQEAVDLLEAAWGELCAPKT